MDTPDRTLLDREIEGLRSAINTRIDGIVKAQDKFEANLQRVPTDVDRAISQLREVINRDLATIDIKFAAAKEINAVERQASADAIKKTEDISRASIDGLEDKLTGVKGRVDAIENRMLGASDQRESTRNTIGTWVGVLGVAVVVGSTFVAITIAVFSNDGGGQKSGRVTVESTGGGQPDAQLQVTPE